MAEVAVLSAEVKWPGLPAMDAAPWWVVVVIAMAVSVLAAVLVAAILGRSRLPGDGVSGHAGETWLTLASAGIATGVAATGMWHVFGDALQMSGPGRVALFAFLEIALFTEAIRARRSLRQFGSVGVDGAAVWALAALSAVLSALDSRSAAEVALRLSAPLVAAWLWERGLAAERRHARGSRRQPVAWRVTSQRVLVWLRLAEPVEREVGEVDRARRVARLVRAAWRYHTLNGLGARPWRVQWAAVRLRRQALAAGKHIRLGSDETVRDQVRVQLAALYQVQAGTAPAALDDLAPWSTRHPQLDAAEHEVGRLSEELAAGEARTAELEASRERLAAELTAVKEQAERDRTASRRTDEELRARLDRAHRERAAALERLEQAEQRAIVLEAPASTSSPTGRDVTADPLLPVARTIAGELATAGAELSKRTLTDELRKLGHSCGSDRALRLLTALRAGDAPEAAA
jgi:hypothetical protein